MIRKFALTAGVIAVVVLGLFVFFWCLFMPRSQFNRVGCDWIKECPYIAAAIGGVVRCEALPFGGEILYLGGDTNWADMEFRAEGSRGVGLARLRLERHEKRWFVRTASFRSDKGQNPALIRLNSECQPQEELPNR